MNVYSYMVTWKMYTQMLNVEQMVTSCGGFQDPMGGVFGGVKIGRVPPCLPLFVAMDYFGHSGDPSCPSQPPCSVRIGHASLSEDHVRTLKEFEECLVLIYTGKTRLSRNLVQVQYLCVAR